MNFELTEERQMLQDMLRRYLRENYGAEARNKIIESQAGFSAEIWAGLAELGVLGALFTEDQGGFGGAGFDIAIVFEELGRAGVVEPVAETCVLGGQILAAAGRADLVEQVIAGGLHLALAHGEPSSRYDLAQVATTAAAKGDGATLNGRKAVVSNAEAAGHLIVSAREADGLSLFLVPRDAGGVSLQGYPQIGGGRAAEITLDDVDVPKDARLGAPGGALALLEPAVAAGTVAICAETLGAMETALRLTTDYLGTRKQFGRPIGTFQALQHRLADMLIELEQARSIVILAAGHLEAEPALRDRHVSAAKHLIGRVGRMIAEESIQMHGGIAMTQEYELAHIAKRIVMADHRLGDTDHHLERFIALGA